jgi:phosphatidylglycerol:prolipoprotein diacylglycerol transferase
VIQNSPISFPGLFGDWQFTASSIALQIGHGVYWYGIILATGLLMGLLLCMKQAKRFGLTEDNVLDMILWAVPCCILGSRIYYVLFYLDLYRNESGGLDWGRVVAIWDGGLAIYGTVIMGFIVAIVYCRVKKLRFAAMADLCVMGLLLGQAIGRWGNFMNREAFGAATTMPWRMRLWTNASTYIEVHPTFLYESLWNLVGLLLLLFVVTKARRFDGENTWFYFLWYGVGRAWIEGMRTDSLYLFDWTLFGQPIRVSQALSVVMVVVSLFMLFYRIKIQKRTSDGVLIHQLQAAAAAEPADAQTTVEDAVSDAPETEKAAANDAATDDPSAEPAAEKEDANGDTH